ncbi:MAG: bifunctional [glutamine synthetase] adenylyltransferase/[glutamine synthetase]-adenylyl-L-tyrosine phosphorylase, partial [Actinobacteria bacterium]|nr:bifunctional [glutamine synthetase] adenylyltransferase/[glutamine synthetase]-adenylyl-L-tyrosine phosphorylase [Actinomycetota bacterium]
GSLWEVDAGLRPEGKDGPLVRTIESHTAYYERWAQPWEFQALLKARTAAGSKDVGARFTAMASLGTWSVAEKPTFVDDVRKMRKRVEEHIPSKDADRHLKLGVGGLRDVEFAVQLLQLVHGKADEDLRVQSTMSALRALSAAGYVGREDGAALLEAYSWMRTLEHRIQLNQLKRSHLIPEDESDLRRIARSMAYESSAELLQQWRERRSLVRSIHEKLFFRPLLAAVARLAADEQRLTPEAAQARLLALGYGDPVGALAHIQALTSGVSRRAAIQRQLLPAMLEWFTQGPDPDAGLFGFRQVSDALGDTPWYLRMLRDSGATAQRLALVLSSSRYASELILRAPEATAMLDDDGDLAPRGIEQLILESLSVVRRQDESDKAIESVRAVRRRELFRTAVADLLGTLSVAEVGDALSDVAGATLEAAFDAASRAYVAEHGPLTIKFAVIALGRLGGNEMSYQSDADVLFVHEYLPGTDEKVGTDAAHWIAGEMRRLTSLPNPEPPLIIDPDLRPDGKQGPLVRSLSAYAHYYAEQALLWERQALLRARPIAGDADLGERFIALIDFYRYPTAGISMSNLREMRRLKARVESERLPRGADKSLHLKLGPGGLSDVEWMAQYLQMNYAGKNPRLRITGTLEVLNRAVAANLLTIADAATLSDSWLLATRIRNAVMLVTARHSDEVPKATESARAVSQVLGFASGEALMEEWRRQSRRARAVFERLFYEDGNE